MSTTSRPVFRWAGTAEVAPRPGNSLLGESTGAFVAVAGIAESEFDFRSRLERAINALNFDLIDVEDIRRIVAEVDLMNFDSTLRERVHSLSEDNPIELGSFHAFSD